MAALGDRVHRQHDQNQRGHCDYDDIDDTKLERDDQLVSRPIDFHVHDGKQVQRESGERRAGHDERREKRHILLMVGPREKVFELRESRHFEAKAVVKDHSKHKDRG